MHTNFDEVDLYKTRLGIYADGEMLQKSATFRMQVVDKLREEFLVAAEGIPFFYLNARIQPIMVAGIEDVAEAIDDAIEHDTVMASVDGFTIRSRTNPFNAPGMESFLRSVEPQDNLKLIFFIKGEQHPSLIHSIVDRITRAATILMYCWHEEHFHVEEWFIDDIEKVEESDHSAENPVHGFPESAAKRLKIE